MIFKLFDEIKPLGEHKLLYDSHKHAFEVMANLSSTKIAEKQKPLLFAGLLHEIEDKLGEYKYKKCLEIIDTGWKPFEDKIHAQTRLSIQVDSILLDYRKPKNQSKHDWAFNLLESADQQLEALLLADFLSELNSTNSLVVQNSIRDIVDNLVKSELLNKEDERVLSILNTTSNVKR